MRMIVYRVTADSGACTPVRYAGQTHLMQLVDQWGLTHCVHYVDGGVHCVVYCAQPAADLAIIVMCSRPVDAALLQTVAHWGRTEGHRHASTTLREHLPAIRPTPNGGSTRSTSDLHNWCDASLDALTHHHVLVNVLRIGSSEKHERRGRAPPTTAGGDTRRRPHRNQSERVQPTAGGGPL